MSGSHDEDLVMFSVQLPRSLVEAISRPGADNVAGRSLVIQAALERNQGGAGMGSIVDLGGSRSPPGYSAALDEIYRLRIALANEANRLENLAGMASFPKGRRAEAVAAVERMRAAARGSARRAYQEISFEQGKMLLETAGASTTLTRSQWEEDL